MTAIYVRQSVDKKDSISIDSQIDECKKKLCADEKYEIFSDKGFSGKTIKGRPQFLKMMKYVTDGYIQKIVVYKVDRISRSMLDFLKMKEEFDKHNVSFISCREDFDTSTATGKMMLSILIMFAEMERDTIQKRITDNYYARGQKGFYLGGYPPFGYKKTDIVLDGKNTSAYIINNEEQDIIKRIYNLYIKENFSLNDIAKYLNARNIKTRKNNDWTGSTLSRLISNPVYVKADSDIYKFLSDRNAVITSETDEFDGIHGCIVYGDAKTRKGCKFRDYSKEFVTIGKHCGIIDSSVFLSAQQKLDRHTLHSNSGTGKLSFLQGFVKCSCGYSDYVKRYISKSGKEYRYFYCRRKKNGTCTNKKLLKAEFLENIIKTIIFEKLTELSSTEPENKTQNSEYEHIKSEYMAIIVKIKNLILAIENSDNLSDALTKRLEELYEEKNNIENKLVSLSDNNSQLSASYCQYFIDNWDGLETNIKTNIVSLFINNIITNDYLITIYLL